MKIVTLLLYLLMAVAPAAEPPPNFIIILADDMGYGDSSVYDGWIETPHLERMAREGLVFSDFHSSGNVCSPTRAGLMTGRYQQRAGIPGVIFADPAEPAHANGIPDREWTLAEALREAGYRTGLTGKWHLGYQDEFHPMNHGFDEFRGFISGNIDYHSHLNNQGVHDWWHGRELVREKGYLTDLITRDATDFIRRHADQPFFLYIAHGCPHDPIQDSQSPPQRGPAAARDPRPRDQVTTGMMNSMDRGIGEILDLLGELGLDRRTLVFFTSDNGAAKHLRSGPLRGGKGSHWEGGHRVPAIVRWPGAIRAGGRTEDFATTLDLMPTLLELAGVSPREDRPFDGASIVKHLLEGTPLGRREFIWDGRAMRDGKWKLIAKGGGAGKHLLFDLSTDLSESEDRSAAEPERVEKMLGRLAAWKRDIDG